MGKEDKIQGKLIIPKRPTEAEIQKWVAEGIEILEIRGAAYGESWAVTGLDGLAAWLVSKAYRIQSLVRQLYGGTISKKDFTETLKDSQVDLMNYTFLFMKYYSELAEEI